MKSRPRLDKEMVDQGVVESRHRARALILAGEVLVDGQPAGKPGTPVPPGALISLKPQAPAARYASRGGLKLEAALARFGVDPTGRVAIDLGASTGGFTDCLLQHGAELVIAVDVGYGILHWRLRTDPRVVVRERLNARYLEAEHLPRQPDLATADLSFISLEKVLPRVVELVPGLEMVALVKPQFEVSRQQVGKNGVVRDPALHREVLSRVSSALATACGLATLGVTFSPVTGPKGNREFFLHLKHGGRGLDPADLEAAVERAAAPEPPPDNSTASHGERQ
jgi:23S rRNA (cytidine1920-2'-O)/16S rRNA (cytidine1409-2'-O)-methyltransferase